MLSMHSTYALAWDARGEMLSYLGRHDEAIAALQHNLDQLPKKLPNQTEGILAFVFARAGRAGDARRSMEHLRVVNGGELPAMGALAAALEMLGDHAGALTMIERAVKQPDAWLQMYNHAERYDALRRDPRANTMMASIEQWANVRVRGNDSLIRTVHSTDTQSDVVLMIRASAHVACSRTSMRASRDSSPVRGAKAGSVRGCANVTFHGHTSWEVCRYNRFSIPLRTSARSVAQEGKEGSCHRGRSTR
ncbi:tetratricopeptide repeat protein [Gemmatimonas groenlandica]|uniref:Tetratricopeptide repeat protein n=1 Tax=Gemmatimonas groenlandica TaxID=2732249 RepID=A0A6M4ISY0_9BACT|nr:tetratricopeptide repeat protein [Gemmatimonas groenlandica]QJR37884.1 tetratricopeptide repeat protein [Gemmatimonas groenlandica]